MSYVINESECTECGSCAEVCPADAIFQTDGGPYRIDPDACTDCGSCESECPVSCISEGA